MIVADTDVLIDALRGHPSGARVAEALESGALATTVLSEYELRLGARRPSEREKVETLLAAVEVLPLDEPAARCAAEAQARLAGQGRRIGTADILIAGICMENGATLLTRNEEHFGRVDGLRLG